MTKNWERSFLSSHLLLKLFDPHFELVNGGLVVGLQLLHRLQLELEVVLGAVVLPGGVH